MAKKKETKEKEAVKEAVDKVSVREPIQSDYVSGDIPLNVAVYTADEVDALLNAKVAYGIVAAAWAQRNSFSAGDYVTRNGKLYKAKVDIPANTAWNANNWQAVTVMAEIPDAVSVMNPAIATSSDEGKAADAYHTKQALDGKADLVNGLVPSNQLPSYVDDVLEYDDTNHFPHTGETGKIYVDAGTNKTYRWSGTQYVEISASDVSLTSEGGYPYQLTVGSTSCNINSVSLDSTAKTISVNGGVPVYFGDSVSVSGGESGPYQLLVNGNHQCYIPVASVNTSASSITVDGNTLYVPSISISGRTITLDGMGYNMYPISWNSTTRMLDLYGNSVTTLYVSDLEWDAAYSRLKHHDSDSSYLIGWEEVSGTLSRTYDRLTVGNKTIYLDGNDLHIGKDSIAIAPSGNILASDIWYDTNRTSTVYSQLQYLIGSDWGALRVGPNGNVLDYNGNAISKGSLKLNGTAIATLSDIPVVYDGLLTLQQNGVQQTTFSANSPNPTTFNVDTYSFATSSSFADVEVKVATCIDSYFSLFAGAFVLVEFSVANTHSAPKLNVNSTGAKPMLSGDGTAFTYWSANQVVPFIYDGSVWRVVGSSYGIDSTPTNGSTNLVTSDGIYQFVGRYALSSGDGISITNSLISVNGTDGHGTTFNNPGGGSPLYIDVDDGSTSQAGIVQLDDTPKEDSTVAATPTSVNTVAKDIAPNWAKANAYAQGAYVTKDGVLYKAKAAIAANTNWNASSWQATSIGEDVALSTSKISGLGDAATKNVGTTSGTVAAGDHTHNTLVSQDSKVTVTATNDGTLTINKPGVPLTDNDTLASLATILGLPDTASLSDVQQALGLPDTATLADAMQAAATPINTRFATIDELPEVPIKVVKQNGTALIPDSNGAVNIEADHIALTPVWDEEAEPTISSAQEEAIVAAFGPGSVFDFSIVEFGIHKSNGTGPNGYPYYNVYVTPNRNTASAMGGAELWPDETIRYFAGINALSNIFPGASEQTPVTIGKARVKYYEFQGKKLAPYERLEKVEKQLEEVMRMLQELNVGQ